MVRLRKTDPEASRPYCPRVKTASQAFASIQSGNLVVCMSRLSFKGELIFSEKKVENRATLSTEK